MGNRRCVVWVVTCALGVAACDDARPKPTPNEVLEQGQRTVDLLDRADQLLADQAPPDAAPAPPPVDAAEPTEPTESAEAKLARLRAEQAAMLVRVRARLKKSGRKSADGCPDEQPLCKRGMR